MHISTLLKNEKLFNLKIVATILLLVVSLQFSNAQNVAEKKMAYTISTDSKGELWYQLKNGSQVVLNQKVFTSSDNPLQKQVDAEHQAQAALAAYNNCKTCSASELLTSMRKQTTQSNVTPNSGITPLTACVINGSLGPGDLTESPRLFRDGTTATCAAAKVYPGASGTGPYYYDTYTYTNTTGATSCVTVTYIANAGGGDCFCVAYLGSFNPANLATNYLSDGGSSSLSPGALVTFSFNLANAATVVLVVNGAGVSTACPSYTLTVDGIGAVYYQDLDGDGFGNPLVSLVSCAPPPGYVTNNLDCNDNNPAIHPGAVEICGNGIDENCDGIDPPCGGCSPTITAQPANTTVCAAANGTFTVAATGTGTPTYQWQVSTNAGLTYTNLTNVAPYSGVTTTILSISGATAVLNGNLYRAVVTIVGCGTINTNAGTLTVNTVTPPTVSPTTPAVCAGGIVALTLAPTSNTATFSSGTISVPIPDNSLAGATHTIAVSAIPAGAIITNFTVALNITHTWVGDLVIALKAPNASILNLDYYLTSTGGAGPTSGFTNTRISATGVAALNTGTNPYNAIFKPDAQLTAPYGPTGPTGYSATVNNFPALYSTLNGNWTLAMYDGGAGDFGPLTSWSITINYGFNQTGIWTPSAGLFLDAAGTIPYAGTSVITVYAKPAASTTYSVTVTQAGCTSAATTIPVSVSNPPSISVQPTAKSVCEGGNTSLNVTATGTSLSYQWQVSTDNGVTWNNIGGATTNSYAITAATISMNGNKFRVIVTDAGPCAPITSSAVSLTVNALPRLTITASAAKLIPTTTSTLTANVIPAGTANTFQWFLNGFQVPGASAGTLIVNIDKIGDYTAKVTDANGCTSFLSNLVTISDSATSIVFLYPNPNRGKFHVRYYTQFYTPNALPPAGVNSVEVRYIAVYDMVGQRIMDKPFSVYAPYGSMDVDLTPWGKGVYLVMIKDVQGHKLAEGRAVVQ